MNHYIVASIGSWNRELFSLHSEKISGHWHFVDSPSDLNEMLKSIEPQYIFFPHWRWIVPENITLGYECICFHMTDVPYGRGGSPLQNLIIRGHKDSMLTALRMEKDLDAGPVYCKLPFSLGGSAGDIYERTSEITWRIIKHIITENPKPTPQVGEPTYFKRRKPHESELPTSSSMEDIYDYIRMLDAEGYPNAFIDYGNFRISFNECDYKEGKLIARAEFSLKEKK